MRAVGPGPAGNAAVGTCATFASKPGDAIVGIIAAGVDAETAVDAQVACVGRVSAVFVVLTGATACDETTGEVFAAGKKANFTGRTRVLGVTQGVHIRTAGAERAGLAPGATAIDTTVDTSIDATVDAAVGTTVDTAVGTAVGTGIDAAVRKQKAAVRIDGGILGTRGGGRVTATGRDRSGQHEVSKESHGLRLGAGVETSGRSRRSLARPTLCRIPRPEGP